MQYLFEVENKKVMPIIKALEKNIDNKSEWNRQLGSLFKIACYYLEIPSHIKKKILEINDYLLLDRIIWKYLNFLGLVDMYRNIEKKRKKKKPKTKESFVYVELLQPFGLNSTLPGKEVYLKNSAYIFCNNKPFIITKGGSLSDYNEEAYGEISWTYKESAILIAILNLSLDTNLSFFMEDFGFNIPIKKNKINGNPYNFKNNLKIKKLIELYYYVHIKTGDYSHTLKNSTNFTFFNEFKLEKIRELDSKINRKNSVLIRCLYYFGKACSFSHHKMLLEESLALQLFALDGIIKLLMKKYRIESFQKFKEFLVNKHNCTYADYLEELYDERTTYVHPQNNIFESWCPDWSADTCFETIYILRELILFYINGKLVMKDYFE